MYKACHNGTSDPQTTNELRSNCDFDGQMQRKAKKLGDKRKWKEKVDKGCIQEAKRRGQFPKQEKKEKGGPGPTAYNPSSSDTYITSTTTMQKHGTLRGCTTKSPPNANGVRTGTAAKKGCSSVL